MSRRHRHRTALIRAALCALGATALLGIGAEAGAAGRPIMKCVLDGEVVYTDLPCRDARRITYELSPQARERAAAKGTPELVYSAPPAGELLHRPWVQARYVSLGSGRNPECPHLEQRMALVQAEETAAASQKSSEIAQERLAVQRNWHRQLGC